MKDDRYIELLNLYVDQQLSDAEARELEAEIARDAERRRTYQQYCRMQKACTRLFETERAQAPASPRLARALADADRKIVAFPPQRPAWRMPAYVGGFMAAAACIAIVLVRQDGGSQVPSPGAVVAVVEATPAANQVAANAQPEAVLAPSVPMTPMYQVLLASQEDASATHSLEATHPSERNEMAWLQRVELPPVRRIAPEALAFEHAPETLRQDNRTFRSRRPMQATAELTAFQFER